MLIDSLKEHLWEFKRETKVEPIKITTNLDTYEGIKGAIEYIRARDRGEFTFMGTPVELVKDQAEAYRIFGPDGTTEHIETFVHAAQNVDPTDNTMLADLHNKIRQSGCLPEHFSIQTGTEPLTGMPALIAIRKPRESRSL